MMVQLFKGGAYLVGGRLIPEESPEAVMALSQSAAAGKNKAALRQNTMAYSILKAHNTSGDMENLRLKFDAMASHDITYVGIIQTARASGLERFPIPYVLTNCHNSLCAVGGTINEDDHLFGLSAARKYGGIYVPPHQAVIHSYMREMQSGCGKMILGSDSHTRYGALGTMAIGEGGGELVKQLLGKTYDVTCPQVVAVYLTGKPRPGVGPQDVALSLIGAVFASGFVKNKVLEFVGDGIAGLNVEFRNGIDVMTTETTCLSSIWKTDGKVEEYFRLHGRPEAYKPLSPGEGAYYDGAVVIDLASVEPMIAMPFHPSNVYTIRQLKENLADILHETEQAACRQLNLKTGLGLLDKVHDGSFWVDQGFIGGCAGGTYDNMVDVADILSGKNIGSGEFSLSIYPASQPEYLCLVQNGSVAKMMLAGATVRSAFCGPCFGAGDVPGNQGFSIRHSTRNFPNREGSKPGEGQIASVALMDARSIAATAINGGRLTSAWELEELRFTKPPYFFNRDIYEKRCYDGFGKPDSGVQLKFGPNITDWPKMSQLTDDLMLTVASFITDDVTTTDELIPSGETSSYRSNPLRLAEFALSRKDPAYVGRAKAAYRYEQARLAGQDFMDEREERLFAAVRQIPGCENVDPKAVGQGSLVYAIRPGDGSAREQAASCQKVLGGWANIAKEYATKRYRSNLINWGMIPFTLQGEPPFGLEDVLFIPGIRDALATGAGTVTAYVVTSGEPKPFQLTMPQLTADERDILLYGCLINYYGNKK